MSLAMRTELTDSVLRLDGELQAALDGLFDLAVAIDMDEKQYKEEVSRLKRDFAIRRDALVLPVLREEAKEKRQGLADIADNFRDAVDAACHGLIPWIHPDRELERSVLLRDLRVLEAAIRRIEERLVEIDL